MYCFRHHTIWLYYNEVKGLEFVFLSNGYWYWSTAPVVQDIVIISSRDIPAIWLYDMTWPYDKSSSSPQDSWTPLPRPKRSVRRHQGAPSSGRYRGELQICCEILNKFFFFKGSNVNSPCLDVHWKCSNRYSLAWIPNVQMFRSWILDVQMFSLPAAWPPASSSRVWLWRGENSLQVLVDIVVNIIVVIIVVTVDLSSIYHLFIIL